MNMQQMLMQAQKMQRDLKKAQDELKAKEFSTSKGGMVTVKMKGDRTITSLEIDKDAMNEDTKDMVQDAIILAINELLEQIEKESEAINEKITGRAGGLF